MNKVNEVNKVNETLKDTLNRAYQRLLQNIHNEPYCNRVIIMIKKEFGLDWRKEIDTFRLKTSHRNKILNALDNRDIDESNNLKEIDDT